MYNVYICVHIRAHTYIYMLLFQKKNLNENFQIF